MKRRKHTSQHILFDALFVSKKARQNNAFFCLTTVVSCAFFEKTVFSVYYFHIKQTFQSKTALACFFFENFLKTNNHLLLAKQADEGDL